ncbi:MAG: UDP-N-acetylmuramoyl-tripeptide--D-alanyl-D-alanine ligase [Bacteroidales bacterium]|nr:UDP-N-acetylmuramoyl-tripeptide--D-alanyl-D-alanine ligase [Bacteroidales bacterium]
MKELYDIYLAAGCRVTTDSRTLEPGTLFFALKGEHFDGNDYAMQALEKGASRAVVSEDVPFDDPRLIRVPDTYACLRDLAIWHRTHVCGGKLPVIGLTGTNGKTTTKELTAAVLSARFRVCATRGNLNNDIGVPLSLLSIRPDTQVAVIEMGASHPDDIAKLVRIAQPDYGLITNVGKAHLQGFGSFAGVKAAKGELYRWLGSRAGSVVFLNEDDADLRGMAAGLPCHVFGYGVAYQRAEILPTSPEEPFLRLSVSGHVLSTRLVGSYNAPNVLAALAVGTYFGVPFADAAAALAAYEPRNQRSQMQRTGRNTLIVDAYNANPSSMAASLRHFAAFSGAPKLALLGDMRELGADSVAEHVAILRLLEEYGIPAYLVGEEFGKALAQHPCPLVRGHLPGAADLAALPELAVLRGCSILIKGSRSMQMEQVIPVL